MNYGFHRLKINGHVSWTSPVNGTGTFLIIDNLKLYIIVKNILEFCLEK